MNSRKILRKALNWGVMIHCYLGIIFGVVILLWCLSGFVMMFVQYPSLTSQERYSYMSPLSIDSCCQALDTSRLTSYKFDSFILQQIPSGPLLKLISDDKTYFFDAMSGTLKKSASSFTRLNSAKQIASNLGVGGVQSLGLVDIDQWSIIPSVAKHAPFEIFQLDDSQKSRLYFSQVTGELVQQVTFVERTWGWVGSVIHWIYPTVIRANTELWVQLVIWLSVISLFMVLVGAFIGITRLRDKSGWRKSPYQGRFLWHHYSSLFTGVLMLTWLFSGLMSMYPWGLMEGRSFAAEEINLKGSGLSVTPKLQGTFENLHEFDLPNKTVEIKGVMVAGFLNVTATDSLGKSTLIRQIAIDDYTDNQFPSPDDLAEKMRPGETIASIDFLTSGDSYYYDHHNKRDFPVYRIIYDDGEHIYLDGLSFDIAAVFDNGRKTARWLYKGLHRGDFFPTLNGGLVWYLSWGGLLLLMTSAVGIACWLAFRYWQNLLVKNHASHSKPRW
ncbi:MAG: PepSY domain-containing protein [Porticoccaceae bacterium]|nr:PepSY domain-containing protein [Porticoccaceae bacterium]